MTPVQFIIGTLLIPGSLLLYAVIGLAIEDYLIKRKNRKLS